MVLAVGYVLVPYYTLHVTRDCADSDLLVSVLDRVTPFSVETSPKENPQLLTNTIVVSANSNIYQFDT